MLKVLLMQCTVDFLITFKVVLLQCTVEFLITLQLVAERGAPKCVMDGHDWTQGFLGAGPNPHRGGTSQQQNQVRTRADWRPNRHPYTRAGGRSDVEVWTRVSTDQVCSLSHGQRTCGASWALDVANEVNLCKVVHGWRALEAFKVCSRHVLLC